MTRWDALVRHCNSLGKPGFRALLDGHRQARPAVPANERWPVDIRRHHDGVVDLEECHAHLQLLGLTGKLLAGRRELLAGRSILLGGAVELPHRATDLAD